MVFSQVDEGGEVDGLRSGPGRQSEVDQVGFLLPMGLQEDAVDVVDVDGFVGGADGLDHAADAEIAGLAQDAVGGADDEVDGGAGEDIVGESGAVEFAQEEKSEKGPGSFSRGKPSPMSAS